MLIADSSVWIDFLRGAETPQTERLFAVLGEGAIGIGDIMLCEVLQGIKANKQFEQVRQQLTQLDVLPVISPEIAVQAARNYRTLRRKGITVRKTIDTLIATFCIEKGHMLLHNDRDFDPFEEHLGLQVVR